MKATTSNSCFDAIRQEFGPTVQIVSANKRRIGDVLGFFTRQRYVALAQVPEPAPRAVIPAAPRRHRLPSLLHCGRGSTTWKIRWLY